MIVITMQCDNVKQDERCNRDKWKCNEIGSISGGDIKKSKKWSMQRHFEPREKVYVYIPEYKFWWHSINYLHTRTL